MVKLGMAALTCYAIHGSFHLAHDRLEEMLWACHVGAVLVGVGLLMNSAAINGIGSLFLCLGTPLWLMDLAGGGEFDPTSCFTHLGALAIGLYGIRLLGMPGGVWLKAEIVLAVLIVLSRLVTPPRTNVNVAFAIYPGMEQFFSSHLVYLVTMMALAAGYFFIVEWVLRRWLAGGPAREILS